MMLKLETMAAKPDLKPLRTATVTVTVTVSESLFPSLCQQLRLPARAHAGSWRRRLGSWNLLALPS
jgi:hypothetical protein